MQSLTVLLALLAAPAAAAPADVAARETGIGTVFLTSSGRSLYTSDRDVNRDESVCTGVCAQNWPPFVSASAAPAGEGWTIAVRPDGSRQWSFRGKPLYLSARDTHPGMTVGEGVEDVWHIAVDLAPRPRAVLFQGTVRGHVAATVNGLTLYTADRDCSDRCLNVWKPLHAPVAAAVAGDWAAVARPDGSRQWTYRGKPVYSFANDLAPGDMKGDGMDGTWHAIVLRRGPDLPNGVLIGAGGPTALLTDVRGMALYGAGADFSEVKRRLCDADCLKSNWTPVPADNTATPRGNWIPLDTAEGPQWSYRGELVFTFNGDKVPGDAAGERFAAGSGLNGFHPLRAQSLIPESF